MEDRDARIVAYVLYLTSSAAIVLFILNNVVHGTVDARSIGRVAIHVSILFAAFHLQNGRRWAKVFLQIMLTISTAFSAFVLAVVADSSRILETAYYAGLLLIYLYCIYILLFSRSLKLFIRMREEEDTTAGE